MTTITTNLLAKYIIEGNEKLLEDAKKIISNTTTSEDAKINASIIKATIDTYTAMSGKKNYKLTQGITLGTAAGIFGSIIDFKSNFLPNIVKSTTLGAIAGLGLDNQINKQKVLELNRLRSVDQLAFLAEKQIISLPGTDEKTTTTTPKNSIIDLLVKFINEGNEKYLDQVKQIISSTNNYAENKNHLSVIQTTKDIYTIMKKKEPSVFTQSLFSSAAVGALGACISLPYVKEASFFEHVGSNTLKATGLGGVAGLGLREVIKKTNNSKSNVINSLTQLTELAEKQMNSLAINDQTVTATGLRKRTTAAN